MHFRHGFVVDLFEIPPQVCTGGHVNEYPEGVLRKRVGDLGGQGSRWFFFYFLKR